MSHFRWLPTVTLIIGYVIWWLFTLNNGQTPGKQLLEIRVMRVDGTASDWSWTFVREFVVKFCVFEVAANSVTEVTSIGV